MNHFNLSLIKFIQENSPVDIDIVLNKYKKTLSTIKRAIKDINDYLKPNNKIHIINSKIVTHITYRDYIQFIHSIGLNRYISTANERIRLFILQSTLFDYICRDEFYAKLNLSYSTLKNDMALLNEKKSEDIKFILKNKKHWSISGNEISIRINFCKNIFNALELDQDDNLVPHRANSPIDNLVTQQFLQVLKKHTSSIKIIYQKIKNKIELSYNSKKYLIIYLSISLYRINKNNIIDHIQKLPIDYINFISILSLEKENQFINILLSAFNHKSNTKKITDIFLYKLIQDFYNKIIQYININQADENILKVEIYHVIYSSILQNTFSIDFDDKKLEKVDGLYSYLYDNVMLFIDIINSNYHQTLTKNTISTIVLILKKFEIRMNSLNRSRKKIYIVTNSSDRKVGYFKTLLLAIFDIEIIDCININEIYILNHKNFDFIITFTNKISNYLKEEDIECIKINFELQPDDIALLIKSGFPSIKYKINKNKFISEIKNMNDDELNNYIDKNYSSFFI